MTPRIVLALKIHDAELSALLHRAPSRQSDLFTAYITLEDIGVKVAEDRRQGNLDRDAFNAYHESLISWHQSYSESVEEQDPDKLCVQTNSVCYPSGTGPT